MRIVIFKYQLLFLVAFQLTNHFAISQSRIAITQSPSLKNGQRLDNYLRLGYRGEVDKFIVISLKFRLDAHGYLDTLVISENAPSSFVAKASEQLLKVNREWNPQKVNGKTIKSKWLIFRFYIQGFRESQDACVIKLEQEFLAEFKREKEIFLCGKKVDQFGRSIDCLIDYVEGVDCYLYPPFLSYTVR